MEFLFDDEWIARHAGVQRVIGAPRRHGEPVLAPERPWETGGFVNSHALFFDQEEQRFKIWYRSTAGNRVGSPPGALDGRGIARSKDQPHYLCYADSVDGIRWTRPSLGLTDYAGSGENNILRCHEVGNNVHYNVVKDPHDPDPARRYKALGTDWAHAASIDGVPPGGRGVCVTYSPDGLRWPHQPRRVADTKEITDADCILGQRERTTGRWVGFFRPRTRPKRRFIGYAESDDFDRWTYPRMLLCPDERDAEWTEFYGLTIACVGRWRVGVLWIFHNNPIASPMTQELVYSRDGLHYQRALPGVEFLPLGAAGAWDSRMVSPMALIERGAEFLLFFRGSDVDHGSDRGQRMQANWNAAWKEADARRRTGIGVAHLPWGQFCGLQAAHDGVVETKWLCNYGTDSAQGAGGVLAVAAVAGGGHVEAEILDHYGHVIPGWDRSASRCLPMEDGRLRFSWSRDEFVGRFGQVSDTGDAIGHVVKLRFYLHRATLYGFQVGVDGASPPYQS